MRIPIVFITDENFIMQTGVAMQSLWEHMKPETEYKAYIVMAECSDFAKLQIMKMKKPSFEVEVVEASLDMYRDIKQMSHIPISCLLKFNICDFIKKEDKLIYLDGDIYVQGDLSEMYKIDLGDNLLGGVPSLDMIYEGRKLVNAGVLLFNAKAMRDEKISEKLIEKRRELGDRGSMDQQTFNLLIPDRIKFISYKYNCIPNKILGMEKNNYPLDKVNKLYHTSYKNKKVMVDDAVILHYATKEKPWNYTYVSYGNEWYECYKRSPYGNKKLKRKTFLEAHLIGVRSQFKNGGIKKLIQRAKWYIETAKGNTPDKGWG